MDDFFRFSKILGFWVFLVHPTVVSVLLSASVERCFVSRMRDFFCISLLFLGMPTIKTKWLPAPLAAAAGKQVSVLLSASVERFGVSRIQTFWGKIVVLKI